MAGLSLPHFFSSVSSFFVPFYTNFLFSFSFLPFLLPVLLFFTAFFFLLLCVLFRYFSSLRLCPSFSLSSQFSFFLSFVSFTFIYFSCPLLPILSPLNSPPIRLHIHSIFSDFFTSIFFSLLFHMIGVPFFFLDSSLRFILFSPFQLSRLIIFYACLFPCFINFIY